MFFITCFECCEESEFGFDGGVKKIVGFTDTLEEADEVVSENQFDIHADTFMYVVIEEIEPGIYPTAEAEIWYAWSEEKNCFLPIERPSAAYGYSDFALDNT